MDRFKDYTIENRPEGPRAVFTLVVAKKDFSKGYAFLAAGRNPIAKPSYTNESVFDKDALADRIKNLKLEWPSLEHQAQEDLVDQIRANNRLLDLRR